MTDRYKDILKGSNQHRLVFVLRFILGAVFLWAGSLKIADPHTFASVIANNQLLPEHLVNSVAVWLPWVEVLCGVLLICGIWIDGSLLVINTLLVLFMAVLILNWIRGIDADCGCFSVAVSKGESNTLMDIIRDVVLLGIGLTIFYSRVRLQRN
jgi:uncharacterized membrane protein YphA (DoxX/SURF4 family)